MGKQIWKGGNMLYPVPAVMVSCSRPGERPNIITVAWCGTVCSDPPMVSVSIRPSRYSWQIIKDSGEFVINLTTRALARSADRCGVLSGRDVDKFAMTRLTPAPSSAVSCPLIEESPLSLECKVEQVLSLGSHDMFIGRVMAVDADEAFMDDKGRFMLEKADPVVYSHGAYFSLGEMLGKFGYSVKKKRK